MHKKAGPHLLTLKMSVTYSGSCGPQLSHGTVRLLLTCHSAMQPSLFLGINNLASSRVQLLRQACYSFTSSTVD